MRSPRLVVAVVASLLVLTGCGGDDEGLATAEGSAATSSSLPESTSTTSAPEPEIAFEPATDGTLVMWALTAGECHRCGYRVRLDSSGTATLDGDLDFASVDYDADALRTLLADLDPRDLSSGRDDCGREVDGNAPRVELFQAESSQDGADPVVIDDCYTTIDRSHPLMALVLDTYARLRGVAVEPAVEVLTYGGRCVDGECRNSLRVAADGTWFHVRADDVSTGALSRDQTDALVRLASEADEESLVRGPFQGTCPTASDGQARTYRIDADGSDGEGIEVIVDTCRHEVVEDAPLIRLLDQLVADIGS